MSYYYSVIQHSNMSAVLGRRWKRRQVAAIFLKTRLLKARAGFSRRAYCYAGTTVTLYIQHTPKRWADSTATAVTGLQWSRASAVPAVAVSCIYSCTSTLRFAAQWKGTGCRSRYHHAPQTSYKHQGPKSSPRT